MGLRFRRSLRIAPGLRLNLGKQGASVSVGGRGAGVTLGRNRIRTTVGIPGTGLSYSKSQRYRDHSGVSVRQTSAAGISVVVGLCLAAAFLWALLA